MVRESQRHTYIADQEEAPYAPLATPLYAPRRTLTTLPSFENRTPILCGAVSITCVGGERSYSEVMHDRELAGVVKVNEILSRQCRAMYVVSFR